jgi:hypothetical protein
MKYLCLGYYDAAKFEQLSESDRNAFYDLCCAYDDELRARGHFLSGEALDGASAVATVRTEKGKVSVTDGPFIETKEQLGGIMVMEAKDLNEAIALWSNHPAIRTSTFEIRPIFDMTPIVEASRQRRQAAKR